MSGGFRAVAKQGGKKGDAAAAEAHECRPHSQYPPPTSTRLSGAAPPPVVDAMRCGGVGATVWWGEAASAEVGGVAVPRGRARAAPPVAVAPAGAGRTSTADLSSSASSQSEAEEDEGAKEGEKVGVTGEEEDQQEKSVCAELTTGDEQTSIR